MTIEWETQNVLFICYFNSIIALISTCSTILAIVAYFKSLTIRQAYQNLLLLNLLVNSIIFSINQTIFYGQMAIVKNPTILTIGWACSLNGLINFFCAGMELYALMCIGLERYFAIKKQKPLTLKQVIGLLMFGWIELGLLVSVPFWNSEYFFTLSSGKFSCLLSLTERNQIVLNILSIANASTFIGVASFCYISIYRYYGKLTRNVRENLSSTIQTSSESPKKETEKEEFKILWTTAILVGWTLAGWTPTILMVTYQGSTGNTPNIYWDMFSSALLMAAICGDSIILLLYDQRWKASLRDMMSFRK